MKRRPRAVARWGKAGGMCMDCRKMFKTEDASARHAAEKDHHVAWTRTEKAAFGEKWRRVLAQPGTIVAPSEPHPT